MNEFKVDLTHIAENRRHGVSGMMRVKNDAEFIEACIESCIEALDELVIVYNDCTDNSPEIIHQMASRYPDKIKVYEYTPHIYAWNLSDREVENIFNGTIPPENTLAGYYNYALSKTTCEYVMKIDADQIYFTERLASYCDLYRSDKPKSIKPFNLIFCWFTKLILSLSSRIKWIINSGIIEKLYTEYISCLPWFIRYTKLPISLSGVNGLLIDNEIYVPLGMLTKKNHIPYPYNGEGDHLIFKVRPSVCFKPFVNKEYNISIDKEGSVIEILSNVKYCFPTGPIWLHLNLNRTDSYKRNIERFNQTPQNYDLIEAFAKNKFKNYIKNSTVPISLYRCSIFTLVHKGLNEKYINNFHRYNYDGVKYQLNKDT